MHVLSLIMLITACGGEPAPAVAAPSAPVAQEAPPAPVVEAGTADAAVEVGEPDADAGKTVYDSYCVACHQADGTGMNGMLAANFKVDKARLAKSDDELLKSIRKGITGPVGTMPPWEGTLSPQDSVNVLAYVRATYGD